MRRFALLLTALVAAASAQYPGAKPVAAPLKKGFDSITVSSAKTIVNTLAGPTFQGRGPQQPGYLAAAGWVAAFLQLNGIGPGGPGGSYFQNFTMQQATPSAEGATLASADGKVKLEFKKDFAWVLDRDLEPMRLQFAFFRSVRSTDLASMNLRGVKDKVLVVSSDTPMEVFGELQARQSSGSLGAFLLVRADAREGDFTAATSTSVKEFAKQDKPALVSLRLKAAAARRMAEAAGAKAFLAESGGDASLEMGGGEYIASGKLEIGESYQSVNVIGKIAGTDPVLKKQAVVIGSHLDHLGVTTRGTFWGADDNASGCTANMLIARAIAMNPLKPKRSVIFGFWALEERGLWGSKVYSEMPTVPMADTVAYLNMDMVGRNAEYPAWGDLPEDNVDAIYVAASRMNSPDLHAILFRANGPVNLHLKEEKEDRTFRSDTGSFAGKGVPTLKAWSGEHPDYHKMTDTPDKINAEKIANVAKWLYVATQDLVSMAGRPKFESGARYLRGRVTMKDAPKLGPTTVAEIKLVDVSKADAPAVVLDQVSYRRPGQFPIMFALKYRPEQLLAGRSYAVQVRILEGGKLKYVTATRHSVFADGKPQDRAEVVVEATR